MRTARTTGRSARPAAPATAPPRVGQLTIDDGLVHFRDAPAKTDVTMKSHPRPHGDTSEATSKATAETGVAPCRSAFKAPARCAATHFASRAARPRCLRSKTKIGPIASTSRQRPAIPASASMGRSFLRGPTMSTARCHCKGATFRSCIRSFRFRCRGRRRIRLRGSSGMKARCGHFSNSCGKVGASDLSGKVTVDRKNERPLIVADLVSKQMNYKDLGGLVGCLRLMKRAVTHERSESGSVATQCQRTRLSPASVRTRAAAYRRCHGACTWKTFPGVRPPA